MRPDWYVPFEAPLPQPEPYLGPQGLEARDTLVLAVARLDRERELGRRLRPAEGEEFRDGYLARVRERICPKPKPEEPESPVDRLLHFAREQVR